jgi:hypothetical protein
MVVSSRFADGHRQDWPHQSTTPHWRGAVSPLAISHHQFFGTEDFALATTLALVFPSVRLATVSICTARQADAGIVEALHSTPNRCIDPLASD